MIFADFYWVWGNRFLAVVVYYDITAIFTTCSWIYTAGFYQVWWLYCSDHPYHSVNGEFATRKSKTKYVLKSCNIEFVNIFHHVFLLLTLPDRKWEDSFWWRPSKVNMVLLSGAPHFAYTMHGHFYFGNIPVYVILCLFSDAVPDHVNPQTVTIKRLPWSGSLQIKLGKDYSI